MLQDKNSRKQEMHSKMSILDYSELKSISIDDYVELCLSKHNKTGEYIVYFDSGDVEIEQSEIMIQTKNYEEAKNVFNMTYNHMC